jgi:hypothetical protein
MLAQSPQVSSVWIVNCNIGEQLSTDKILSSMPMGLTDLNLRNTLIRVEPNDLSALPNLRTLYVHVERRKNGRQADFVLVLAVVTWSKTT